MSPSLRGVVLLVLCACAKPVSKELGVLEKMPGVQGRDGAVSALLWGRSVWDFGDTVLEVSDVNGENWHHNSFSYTSDLDARDGLTGFEQRTDDAGAPVYFVAPTDDEWAFNHAHLGENCAETPCGARWAVWPGTMVFDESSHRALIFYGLIYAEPGDFNFRGVGSSVATWSSFDELPQRPVVSPGAEHPTLLFGENEPPWGTSAAIVDGQLYVFGCGEKDKGLAPPCRLARVEPASVLDRSAWRFFDGAKWVEDQSKATVLFEGAPSMTLFFNKHLDAWSVVYAMPLSNDVVLRTASKLTGPWTAPRKLFTANKPEGSAYDSNVHPELAPEDGKELFITYSRSNGVGWFGSEFVLERVELP